MGQLDRREVIGLLALGLISCGDGNSGRSSQPAVQSIAVTPNPFATGVGIARQLTATGTLSDGSQADLTASATWTSAFPSTATVTAGLVTGVATGSTAITATSAGVSGMTTLTVSTNTWSPTGSLSANRQAHTATLLGNGKVLVVGGLGDDPESTLASVEIYDPRSMIWSPAASLTNQRLSHTATLLPDGTVLVVGGLSEETPPLDPNQTVMTSVEIYDPVANTWSAGPSMTTPRSYHTATLLPNGTVLVVGGIDSPLYRGVATTEIYDPVAKTWTSAGSLAIGRYNHTATLLTNNQVLIAGGMTQASPVGEFALYAELYDTASNTWVSNFAAPLLSPRASHTATLLQNGAVLVAGGQSATSGYTTSAEIYDPAAADFSAVTSMTAGRESHTATLLTNGTVLVAGGEDAGGPMALAEIYDPVANVWSPVASMNNARVSHTATRLPNGLVLAAGGALSRECELYW
jgi:N-acetylneuraminic acid mutarotase